MAGSVQFYHLTNSTLERALPHLLQKINTAGLRVSLVAGTTEQADRLNRLLWTYDPDSFLPHGTPEDGLPEAQPILIDATLHMANVPQIVVITDGSQVSEPARFKKVLDLFDGRNEAELQAARTRWKAYRDQGCALTYLQQSPVGRWEEKAAA